VPTANLDQQVQARLATRGVRYTRGRRVVVGALARAEGPRSAAELHDQLDGAVPLSSLYRSLAVLEDSEVVALHHGTKGLTRYELAEWLAGHHHHVICLDCGMVDDIRIPGDVESALEGLVDRLAASAGFRADGHVLEIQGRCLRCD